jgi:hypothetical protein
MPLARTLHVNDLFGTFQAELGRAWNGRADGLTKPPISMTSIETPLGLL